MIEYEEGNINTIDHGIAPKWVCPNWLLDQVWPNPGAMVKGTVRVPIPSTIGLPLLCTPSRDCNGHLVNYLREQPLQAMLERVWVRMDRKKTRHSALLKVKMEREIKELKDVTVKFKPKDKIRWTNAFGLHETGTVRWITKDGDEDIWMLVKTKIGQISLSLPRKISGKKKSNR